MRRDVIPMHYIGLLSRDEELAYWSDLVFHLLVFGLTVEDLRC